MRFDAGKIWERLGFSSGLDIQLNFGIIGALQDEQLKKKEGSRPPQKRLFFA